MCCGYGLCQSGTHDLCLLQRTWQLAKVMKLNYLFACDADRQQPREKLKFRWGWVVTATLPRYGRSLKLGTSYILSHASSHSIANRRLQHRTYHRSRWVFRMATSMVLSVSVIVPITRLQGRWTPHGDSDLLFAIDVTAEQASLYTCKSVCR